MVVGPKISSFERGAPSHQELPQERALASIKATISRIQQDVVTLEHLEASTKLQKKASLHHLVDQVQYSITSLEESIKQSWISKEQPAWKSNYEWHGRLWRPDVTTSASHLSHELSQLQNDLATLKTQLNMWSSSQVPLNTITPDTVSTDTPQEAWWLSRQLTAVWSKETWKEKPLENILRVWTGIGLVRWAKKLFDWFRGKKNKTHVDKDNADTKGADWDQNAPKKPWYKRWYTWLIGWAAALLWWRYRHDIKAMFLKLFGVDGLKKDTYANQIVGGLWADWTYNAVTNTFLYKNSLSYTWEDFAEKWLIKTTVDAAWAMILDLDATVAAISAYVAQDTTTQPNSPALVNTLDHTVGAFHSLEQSAKAPYETVWGAINSFYTIHQKRTAVLGSLTLEQGNPGAMLYHLNTHFRTIGTLLNEQTFANYRNATTESLLETLMRYFPQPILDAFYAVAKAANVMWLDDLAKDGGRMTEFLQNLKPDDKLKLNDLCLKLFDQWTAISYYYIAVREAYADRVKHDPEKLRAFELLPLSALSLDTVSDEDLRYAITHPHVKKDFAATIESRDNDSVALRKRLEKAKSPEQQKQVIEKLIATIDSVGYQKWYWALAVVRWHIRESQWYLEYQLLADRYDEYIGHHKRSLQELSKKNPLTPDDITKVGQHIDDFYATMKWLSTQVEVWQETDEDWNLISGRAIPFVQAWKISYQVFQTGLSSAIDNFSNDNTLAWVWDLMIVTGVVASADLLTYPLRKVWAMKKVLVGRPPIVLSPTVWALKKLAQPVIGLWLQGAGAAWNYIFRAPLRKMHQSINAYAPISSFKYRFKNIDELHKAIHLSHITLHDAAKMLVGKANGSLLWSWWFEIRWRNRRDAGFGDDVHKNMLKLVESNSWVRNNLIDVVPKKEERVINEIMETLVRHRDSTTVIEARRTVMNGTALDDLLKSLRSADDLVAGAATAAARTTASSASSAASAAIERSWTLLDDASSVIARSEKHLIDETKKVFAEFNAELTEEARKLWVRRNTPEYDALSKKIHESGRYAENTKLSQLLADHNALVAKTEQELLRTFNKKSWPQKVAQYNTDSFIKRLVDANGGLDAWKVPWFGKTWRMISVGVHAVMLAWIGSSPDEDGNKKSWSTLAVDAADFGLGMIPVAGGVYDIGMAFRGKDLNGRDMGTWERRIRGSVGLITWVLDVFTFGVWWTAIRAAVKWGTKVVVKAGSKTVAKEAVEVASKWLMQWTAKQIGKNAATDILIGTTAWLALVPVVDHFTKVPLDE
jgi:hypothetical protein